MKNKVLTSKEIISILNEKKNILERYTVKKIGLFGSFAKDKQNKNSDIDLIVEFGNPDLDNFMNLVDYLENLFGRKVEVLTPIGVDTIRIKEVAEDIKRSVIYV
ncbi:MAG: nucleotidyltransferase domain-containing protein [Actinobacteria bacterium]|nr:nucleotidyltransferase domain-containing protein [Actinomycetota bacterium]MBU4450630.1 nucleotidyltransferase domain-containing protein [Actinomycetota bacterium]MCG2788497.1 nucleotidyltransferase domain-containing protein [Actinomycetes bacterium]